MPPAKKFEDKYTAKASLWNLVISVITIGFYLNWLLRYGQGFHDLAGDLCQHRVSHLLTLTLLALMISDRSYLDTMQV
jgi:hypothetical protein